MVAINRNGMRRSGAVVVGMLMACATLFGVAGRSEAAGLSCAQMKARGYSYAKAVSYWRSQGFPARLDADNNGIPCETVYSAASVRNYWGTRAVYDEDIPSGLLCRDLLKRGYTYGEALGYWRAEGYPSRMDADNNGIPCETVYPAADVQKYYRIY